MPAVTDDQQRSDAEAPEALIEEARQLQRRRVRRRTVLLTGLAILVALGIGVGRLARGGGGVTAAEPATAAPVGSPHTVLHTKFEVVKHVPGLADEKRVDELWSASDDPWTYRWVVRLPGRSPVEIGAARTVDPTIGAEQVDYLYEPASGVVYRTGATLAVGGPTLSPRQFFHAMISQPDVRVTGSTHLYGHEVYVVEDSHSLGPHWFYIDKRTYVPLKLVEDAGGGSRIVTRTIFWKTLPATTANVAQASLAGRHPRARTLAAPERARARYAEATWNGTIAYQLYPRGN